MKSPGYQSISDIRGFAHSLFGCGHRGNVGVHALIPVEEALHVDLIADFQVLHRKATSFPASSLPAGSTVMPLKDTNLF